MMEKIEWYQEVLELEPSSKVFFPLAKLLQSNNRPGEAIATLRQGLDRHPEFFEARLMLIDLLESTGQSDSALEQVERLGSKLDLYPGFWQAWAGVCEQQGQANVSVALRLLAAFLSGREISLVDILQNGLKEVLGNTPMSSAAPRITLAKAPAAAQTPPQTINAAGLDSLPEPGLAPAASPVVDAAPAAEVPAAEQATPSAPVVPNDETELDLPESDEEPFSLRTKTMAAVLVEQGDLQGALDIYEELLAGASGDKQAELQARIDEIKLKMKGSEPAAPEDAAKSPEPLQGKQKLLDALENLAKRLEVRAGEA